MVLSVILKGKAENMEKREWRYSGTIEERTSIREQVHDVLARKVAEEAMVLLKNESLLPLPLDVPMALFGSGAKKTVKGGIGSGDVNNRKTISVYQGLLEAGAMITSEAWLCDYEKRYEQAREEWKKLVLEETKRVENPFDAYSNHPFCFPEGRAVTEQDIAGAGVAVYVLSRISGEGSDRRKERGDYELSRREQEDLLFLNEKKIPVVLLLNTGGPVELDEAALIDGASPERTFFSIIFPLLKPITMTNIVFVALSIWNDYILASTLLSLKEVKTLPLMTYAFLTTKSADYAPMMAGLVLTMLPVMILYLFGQRYIIEGIVAGSVKG